MTKKETILEKVGKLLAKAKGTDSLAEAETFMAKANELLMMHELSMMDLDLFKLGQDKNQQIVEEGGHKYYENSADGGWEVRLISMLAKHHFCTTFFNTYRYKREGYEVLPEFTLVGTAENIAVVKMLYDHFKGLIKMIGEARYIKEVWTVREKMQVEASSLEEAADIYNYQVFLGKKMNIPSRYGFKGVPYPIVTAADVMPKSYADKDKNEYQPYFIKNLKKFEIFENRAVYMKSFLIGAVVGFDRKLKEQRKDMTASTTIGTQVAGLVLIKDAAIKKYMDEAHPKMGTFASPSASSTKGFNHGVEEGSKLSIHEGVRGSSARAIS